MKTIGEDTAPCDAAHTLGRRTSAAYRALFRLLKGFHNAGTHGPVNIQTLVLMHRGDEVISYGGIRKMVAGYGLDQWRITPIPNHQSRLEADLDGERSDHIRPVRGDAGKLPGIFMQPLALPIHLLGNGIDTGNPVGDLRGCH